MIRGRRGARTLLIAAGLPLAVAPLAAQQPQQFRAAVETVRVDAVVTDSEGNFVDDLRAGEFTLFEDGERREIVSVELVDLAARQVRRVVAGEETAAVAAEAPRVSRAAAGERASDLGAMIFFIDLPGLTFKNSIDFAESMRRVFARIERTTLPYAIYLVDMSGRLREIQPLTASLDALQDAAGTVRSTPASVSRENLFHLGALEADRGPTNRLSRLEERARTIYTFGLLHDFVESLAHRSGRTALVWVSTGVDLTAYETIERPYFVTGEQNPTPGARFRNYSPDLHVLDLQQELHRAANSANVSIYSVDPSTLADFYSPGATHLKRRDGSAEDARGNSLRNAAHATGGDVFIGWTDLDSVLETIERDAGRFYLLSYSPPDGGEGEYHEIRVEVARSGTDVRARQGYTRYTEADRRSRTVRSALDLPGTVSGLDVSVQGVRAREGDGQSLLIVETAVRAGAPGGAAGDAAAVSAAAVTAGDAATVDGGSLLVFATVRDAEGDLVATTENEHMTPAPGADRGAAGAEQRGTYWTHRAAHRLEPGKYDVSVTVFDPGTERVGAGRLAVDIADAAGEWDVSDPWLVAEEQDGATVPVIDGRVSEGERVFMYVEVYNGVSPEVGGRVLPSSGLEETDLSRAVGDDAAVRHTGPSIALAEAGGVHRGSIPLMALPAGHYVLDFFIDDDAAGRSKTVRLPLEVVSAQRQ